MDSLISTFHIDWKIMLAQAINFGIVFLALWYFAIKPIRKLMDERSHKIAEGLAQGQENAILLANTQKAYDEALAQARREGADILTDAKRNADQKRAELLKVAEADVEALMKNGKASLEAEKQKMLDDAKKELGNLVISATEKVLTGTMTPKIDAALVDNAVKELK
ncbi:F0F1 ATP synthase subunit B [Candidatus Nomurabacteria bacterium]|jgi:F-type H+-transporting ATPase subunit b|nr:MAG: F0F1 ATP synthase subunit B [Candidatus Nomurabacteria bacterium]